MDHSLYVYRARPSHGIDGATPGLSAFAVLFLEHWELEPSADSRRDPRLVGEFGSFTPDYRSWSQREYGLRVGVFRVIEALREVGIVPAIAANAMAVQRLPKLVQIFNDWGCEWVAHGIASTRMMHAGMSLENQRVHIATSLGVIADVTGHRPLGWLSQDWGTTPQTPALLVQAGVRYTLDWVNDDQPYWMCADADGSPALLSIPLSAEWDDVQCQWLRFLEPRAHAKLTLAGFERLRTESQTHGQSAVFGLPIHPWLAGMPSRIAAMRGLLADLRSHADVSWVPPGALFKTMPAQPR